MDRSSGEKKRDDQALHIIDGRNARANSQGYIHPERSPEVAEKLGLDLSPFPHFNPNKGHMTDVVNTGNTTSNGFPIMQRVSQPGGKGSKFAVMPDTGHMLKIKAGAADTTQPMDPPLSPRTMQNAALRFNTFKGFDGK